MDIERTMQFILDQQARTEVLRRQNEERWQRAEQRLEHSEQRLERAEKRQDRFDLRVDAIRKLIVAGMKMLNQASEERREMRAGIRELVASRKRTDQKFDRLIDTLVTRGGNGHR